MKVTIQNSTKNRVDGFFEFLKKRAGDPEHIQNHDVIADFVDKFLVAEMKRLTNEPDVYDETVEIPDDLLLEPLRRAKAQLDKTFEDFLKGKPGTIQAQPVTAEESSLQIEQTDKNFILLGGEAEPVKVAGKRNGNGHKKVKTRPLTEVEKDDIKAWFVGMNGMVYGDHCRDKHRTMALDLGVFQVTGIVTQYHYQVADRTISLDDRDAYLNFMANRFTGLFNSPKYQARLAAGNAKAQPQTGVATGGAPKLAVGFPQKRRS